jgi:hypothetical protein
MKKLLIIPAYNEADSLVDLVADINKSAPDYDYIIINDGSNDHTKEICLENGLNALHLINNLGIGGAVQTGYLYAIRNNYDIAIQIDGDGQHNPAYLDALIQPIVEGKADFTIGSRFIEKEGFQSSGLRRAGILWLDAILKRSTGLDITDATSGFRACDQEVMHVFASYYPKDYPEPETIADLYRHKFRIKEVPVVMRERQIGVSSIRFFKPIYYMLKVTVSILISRLKRHKKVSEG